MKVVCAWGGTGKSTLAKSHKEFIDLENSDYMWVYDYDVTNMNDECKKGLPRHLNPDWPQNYLHAIYELAQPDTCILCGTRIEVIKALESEGISFLLILPSSETKEIYRERFKKRGNNNDWINNYLKGWDEAYRYYQERKYKVLMMEADAYLDEYIEEMKQFIQT